MLNSEWKQPNVINVRKNLSNGVQRDTFANHQRKLYHVTYVKEFSKLTMMLRNMSPLTIKLSKTKPKLSVGTTGTATVTRAIDASIVMLVLLKTLHN